MSENTQNNSLIKSLTEVWNRRKWVLLASFILVFSVGASLILSLPSMYRASTTILLGQEAISESLITSEIRGELEQRVQLIQQAILSRSQLQQIIDKFDLYPELRQVAPPESIIRRLRQDIIIEQQASSRTNQNAQRATVALVITFRGWDAVTVAGVANELAQRYRIEYENMRLNQASRTTEFLREQLDDVEGRLANQEAAINEFKIAHLGQLPQQENMNLSTLERLNAELRLNSEKQFQLMNQSSRINAFGEPNRLAPVSGELRLNLLKQELAALRIRYNESYPGVIRLKNEIAKLEQSIGNGDVVPEMSVLVSEPERLKIQEQELRARISELQLRIENTPAVEQDLRRLNQTYDTIREEYAAIQNLYQDARLAETLEQQQNQQYQVLEPAIQPDFPFAPNRPQLLIGLLMLAGAFSAILVFVIEQMNSAFYSLSELRSFTRLPILGSIPAVRTASDQWRSGSLFLLISAGFFSALVVMVLASYRYGSNAEQLVWALTGGST